MPNYILRKLLRIMRCVDLENAFLGRNKHSLLRLHVHVERLSGYAFRMFRETRSHLKRNTFHGTGVHNERLPPKACANLSRLTLANAYVLSVRNAQRIVRRRLTKTTMAKLRFTRVTESVTCKIHSTKEHPHLRSQFCHFLALSTRLLASIFMYVLL